MFKRAFVFVLAVSFALTSAAAADTFRLFTDPQGAFTVEAPAEFESLGESDMGGLPGRAWRGREGGATFMFIAIDASSVGEDTWSASPAALVTEVTDGAAQGKTIISRRKFAVEGGAAEEVLFAEGDGVFRMRFVVKRPYILNVTVGVEPANRALLDGPAANRFLDSARITSR